MANRRPHPRAIHFFSSILLSSSEGDLARQFWDKVKSVKNIAITTHINPDGDAIGSLLAMYHTLCMFGKDPVMVCQDPAPPHLAFLPGTDLIMSPRTYADRGGCPELVIIVDCSHPSRIGDSMEIVERSESLAIVDHHADSTSMSGIQIVDERASSTGEIIFRLLKHENLAVTSNAALCLYVAILTDTGSFRYGNTSSVSFSIASELMQTGAIDIHSIGINIFARDSVSRLKLRGMVFDRVELRSGIIHSFITPLMIEASGSNMTEAEGVIDDLSLCNQAEIAAIFWELPDDREPPDDPRRACPVHDHPAARGGKIIRVQLRSIHDMSVLNIARSIGGGGHMRSAGGRMKNTTLQEAREKVFAEAELQMAPSQQDPRRAELASLGQVRDAIEISRQKA